MCLRYTLKENILRIPGRIDMYVCISVGRLHCEEEVVQYFKINKTLSRYNNVIKTELVMSRFSHTETHT